MREPLARGQCVEQIARPRRDTDSQLVVTSAATRLVGAVRRRLGTHRTTCRRTRTGPRRSSVAPRGPAIRHATRRRQREYRRRRPRRFEPRSILLGRYGKFLPPTRRSVSLIGAHTGGQGDRRLFRPRSYHRDVGYPSAQAQPWFDRGLIWAYAFNHDEAIRCFDKALSLDPDLAIARWGVAYAIGPNYNKAWEAFDPVDLAASAGAGPDGTAAGGTGPGDSGRTRPDRRTVPPFPHRRPQGYGGVAAGRAAYADAMAELAATLSQRHRRPDPGRRRTGQRHRLGAVGHQHR